MTVSPFSGGHDGVPEVMEMSRPSRGHGAARCGAKKKQGEGFCTQVAGFGTDHVGEGRCKFHGGSTKNQRTAASRAQVETQARRALEGLGVSEPIANPLLELQRLAAEVLAFKNAIRNLVERLHGVGYEGPVGEQVKSEVIVYERALDRSGRVLKDIAALRIDERLVEIQLRVSQVQGEQVAGVIQAILADLVLTPEQSAKVRDVVPRRLRELGSNPKAIEAYAGADRRLTLADFDREIARLREEAAALPAPEDYRPVAPWAGGGDADR